MIGTSGERLLHDEIALYYRALLRSWGPQNWWPAQSRFEMIVGAYLTQNTAWVNVEKAMRKLRQARALNVESFRRLPAAKLARLIRPSGYYRQKARKLKIFVRFLDKKYGGSLDRMFAQPTNKLRAELLALNGVGPETADSILLYAGNHSVFVVDAYTHRIFERHGLVGEKPKYEETRAMVEAAIGRAKPESLMVSGMGANPRHTPSRLNRGPRGGLVQHYNEFHALIVKTGFDHCRTKPKCEDCPLRKYLPKTLHSLTTKG